MRVFKNVLWRGPVLAAGLAFLLCTALPVLAQTPQRPYPQTEQRAPCADYQPLRQPFFGDTHVHTAYSLDAALQGTRNTPEDAYRFARGEELGVQPYDRRGRPLRTLQLQRPLDFTVVSDHGEMLGEVSICSTPGADGYYALHCLVYRWLPKIAFFWMNDRASDPDKPRFSFCKEDDKRCLDAAKGRWGNIQEAAENAYDRSSSCDFTSFVGYEWTANSEVNLHRNVVFRNRDVPALPISVYEAGVPEELWRQLRRNCLGNCDVITIPHNSNLSDGLMFPAPEQAPLDALAANLRAQIEPVLEVFQHKGDSECWFGEGATDELCAFEKLPYSTFRGKFTPDSAKSPGAASGFARGILADGLRYAQKIGANPYQLGFIGSTDTHLGTPGQVAEDNHPAGHGGAGKGARKRIPKGLPDTEEFNPGGLAVVWAEENTRDSLFAALRRRETYSTSGPRIRLRFFGGWNYGGNICSGGVSFASRGYAGGVPMGGVLRGRPTGGVPRFAIQAARDPGAPGRPGMALERIQLVKVSVDANGESRERVYDVSGRGLEDPRQAVDLQSCTNQGGGFYRLCTTWRDPDFNPREQAYYYARVLELPTCRWSQQVCNARGVDCERPETVGEGLEFCCSAEHRPVIQERALSSPIWYNPGS